MRTLKKSLALVLALVMLLGLGVVGASADNALDNYTDADEIGDAYLEAVGVLTGLGIVDGMTETTIVPQATYTRAQAAKIITTMVLGVNGAKSCVASYAPFDDVAANHWAAGYIAFCKEQGIIDGVTDTTFDPEGTLTGYQWAKMLLAAVGFNANNELEGASWSLNTARIGHEVGLFNGDSAAADHTPLRREQAMLYAFNTLSGIKQVTYSANATNYVYGIKGYVFADGTGYTLGEKVFKLAKVEGQIVDNEGMGASATVVDPVASRAKNVSIKAGTGLDLMYHAVRAWYVADKNNTGVYVYDLAKTTEYTCRNIATGDKAVKDLPKTATVETPSIGYDTGKTEYESYLIDNRALDLANDYAYVSLYADFGALTYRNTKAETTTIDGQLVDNDDIMTDISNIKYGDTVIYVKAESTLGNGEAWYVYPVTSTEGVVSKIEQTSGKVISVTLTDGTVLPMSNFFGKVANDTETFIVGNKYSFMLDSHGDVMGLTRDGARDLWAFTGDYKWTNQFGDYFSDYVVEAQFVNVSTGEVADFAVNFVDYKYDNIEEARNDYFDISASTIANGLYLATEVTASNNVYADSYIITGTATFGGSNDTITYREGFGVDNTAYYDPDSVHFIIVSGKGSGIKVAEFDGVDKLLAGFGVTGTVTLTKLAAVVTSNYTNEVATTVFAFSDELVGTSDYVFVPYDVSRSDWSSVEGNPLEYYVTYNDVAYLNGEAMDYIRVTKSALNGTVLERGFYTYTVDAKGNVTLTAKAENSGLGCYYGRPSMIQTANYWKLTAGGHTAKVYDDVKVLDLRTTNYGKVTTVEELYQSYYTNGVLHNDANLTVAYTVDGKGNVNYIYVVDESWGSTVTVDLADELVEAGWVATTDGLLDRYDDEITVVLSNNKAGFTMTGADITVFSNSKGWSVDGMKVDVVKNTVTVKVTADWTVADRDDVIYLDLRDFHITYESAKNDYWDVKETEADVVPGEYTTVTLTRNDGGASKDGIIVVTFADGKNVITDEVAVKEGDETLIATILPTDWANYTVSTAWKA